MSETGQCTNCGTALSGPYCASCGQRARDPRTTLGDLARNIVDDLFELDSRVWRTLGPLLVRPGLLTREYVSGRRAHYLPPLRTYLVASLAFFLVASFEDADALEDPQPFSGGGTCAEFDFAGEMPLVWSLLGEERLRAMCETMTAEGGSRFSREISQNVPGMLFFFLPLFAIALRVLHYGSGRTYVEHLLFCAHCHSAFFIVLTFQTLTMLPRQALAWAEPLWSIVDLAVLLYVVTYLLMALRRFYEEGWLSTYIKFLILAFVYVTGLVVTFLLTVAYTVFAMSGAGT